MAKLSAKRKEAVNPRTFLAAWMMERRYSQTALAKRAGISQRTMALVMRGQRITDRTAMALAPVVGVSWKDLYEEPVLRRGQG